MRVRFPPAAFMGRIKKTSSQPKRKIKTVVIPKKVYPEYIENFIKEVESKTPFKVKVDQYSDSGPYHIGVNKKQGNVYHCIWMVGYVTGPEFFGPFWDYWKRLST